MSKLIVIHDIINNEYNYYFEDNKKRLKIETYDKNIIITIFENFYKKELMNFVTENFSVTEDVKDILSYLYYFR